MEYKIGDIVKVIWATGICTEVPIHNINGEMCLVYFLDEDGPFKSWLHPVNFISTGKWIDVFKDPFELKIREILNLG